MFGAIGAFLSIALTVGVLIAGAVIADSLSAREERKQEQMRDDYDSYCSERRSQYNNTVSSYQNIYNSKKSDLNRDFEEERRRQIEALKENNRPLLEKIKANLAEQRKSKTDDLTQLLDVLSQWEKIKKTSQSTMLRMKSVKRSILTIDEACYKLQAYLIYLNRYENNMDFHFNKDGSITAPFSMTLPEYFPYPGKIYYLPKSSFYLRYDKYTYDIPDEKNLSLFLRPEETELFEKSDCATLPFMVCYNKKTDKLAGLVSISKAQIKNSANSTDGIYAEIEDIFSKRLMLLYEGQRLVLERSDMPDPGKIVPKGSYMFVYLTDYDFALKGSARVSGKLHDSISLASFENVGMMISNTKYLELCRFLTDKKWIDLEDEWRIGPADLNESPVKHIKLQMGDNYGYLAEFKPVGENFNEMYLEFQRMLDKSEFFTFSDIFAAANVTVECHSLNRIDKKLFYEGGLLFAYLSSEFTSQKRILKQSQMMLYFDKWLELTNRLAEVLQYKNRITLEIDSWECYGRKTHLYTAKKKSYLSFLKKAEKSHKPSFLLHIPSDKDTYLKCNYEIIEESDEILITVKDLSEEQIKELDFKIDLIQLNNVYAEKLQSKAFSDFREGRVSKLRIKEIILQPADLYFCDSENRIAAFYNTDIPNNEQQFNAVHRAFSVEDFFIIQGPPGTGKTTVIKELIMQQLHFKPDSKILVVSQANVAVDNVLRGILKLCHQENCVSESQMIRCGTDDRIADDIKPLSFAGRLEKYISDLKKNKSDYPELRREWIDFAESQDNRGIVGECLLRGFQIIGATCVGFANRNIGLSGLEFDLVIIDEAGKALPGELLIPINRANKLVLIGDHKQLPPVINPEMFKGGAVQTYDVIDEEEQIDFYNKSFFERLWTDCPESNRCMLNVQFRMPPVIAGLVNIFYDGKLVNGDTCCDKTPLAFDSHLVLLDMKDEKDYFERQKKDSGPYNLKEQDSVVLLVKKLSAVYPDSKRIVVITPYKNQKKQLIKKLEHEDIKNVWVNTIDAFQGDEEDIVIYCMTRSRKPTLYFSDAARLNVAFSRAKNLLIIIGSSEYLKSYGEDHIIYSVYNYIKMYGRVIPFQTFEKEDFSVENLKKYSAKTTAPKASRSYNDNLKETVDEIFLRLDEHTEEPHPEKCRACGKALSYGEEILCLSCLNSAKNIVCKECGNIFQFPLYLKYVKKLDPPETCYNCRKVPVICSFCGEKFNVKRDSVRERMYCKNCREDVTVKCSCCQSEVIVQKFRLKLLERDGKEIYCEKCRESIEVTCDCCGKNYSVIKWMFNNRKGKGNRCPACREEVTVSCECCGRDFGIQKYHLQELQSTGKGVYCEKCWEKIPVTCNRCGNPYTTWNWMYNKLRSNSKGCLCEECRSNRSPFFYR